MATFTSLPIEVQKGVIQHVPRKHLFKVQKLSRHFFSLATAELYSDLKFRFTSSGAKDDDTPATRLSDALHTFATSRQQRNYGHFVKSFTLSISQEDSFNATTLTRLFWPTGSDSTKILNTLMLLFLEVADTIETFQWDVPVEITLPVFQILHKRASLRNLRIRSAGIPIKLAIQPSWSPPPGFNTGVTNIQGTPATNQGLATLSATAVTATALNPTTVPPAAKRLDKKAKSRNSDGLYSGFNQLASVAFTDLTNLDCLTDIAGCIKASSSSLRSISLSLSSDLANKSREPPTTTAPPQDVDDGDFSDDTEDALNADLPNSQAVPETATAADVRKDKLAQDAILARIFDMQGAATEGKHIEAEISLEEVNRSCKSEERQSILTVVTKIAKALATALMAGQSDKKGEILRSLKILIESVERVDAPEGEQRLIAQVDSITSNNDNSPGTSASANGDITKTAVAPLTPEQVAALTKAGSTLPGLGEPEVAQAYKTFLQKLLAQNGDFQSLAKEMGASPSSLAVLQKVLLEQFGGQGPPEIENPDQQPPTSTGKDEADEMDIDMDHPDESTIDLGPDQEMADMIEPDSSPRKRAKVHESLESGSIAKTEEVASSSKSRESGLAVTQPDINETETPDDRMQKYIRATHGLQLEEFALCLIPLKASILARALDLSKLKRITLLDVGPQVAFWQLLHRLGKSVPDLGFHMIHTDDVSTAFLNFLSTFDGLRELYLHNKAKKTDSETPGPKVDIKVICNIGLRRHFDNITHLMIKNDAENSWDLDQWAVRKFSLRATGLVELAVNIKLQTLHTLVQHITCFTSLRTLYFIHLRVSSGPTSPVLENDLIPFLIDSLVRFPAHKLKYIGIAERYTVLESPIEVARRLRLLAEKRAEFEKRKNSAKGKGREYVYDVSKLQGKGLDEFISDDGFDEEGFDHLVLRAKESNAVKWHYRLSDVEDCKVFQKVFRIGKLVWGI